MATPQETRERILREYGWNATSGSYGPGRFEGEAIYAPLFAEWSGDGFGDPMYAECESDECAEAGDCSCESEWLGDVFEIDNETRAIFPEIGMEYGWAVYYVSDQGFAYIALQETDPRES